MKRKRAPSPIVQQPVAQSYARFLAGIKERIRTAQVKAALAANAELVLHYWEIGGDILANQARQGWGAKVIDRLAADLQQIPWGHNCVLLDRVRDAHARAFYIRHTIQHGWARSVLVHQIDTQLHKRQGLAPTNFARALPAPESDLAREMLKDPYILQPAALDESANERALESALLARLKDFLIELGSGFAFVGNQVRLEVNGEEFFLDLLFYHTRLHCYIVIDLKVVDFQPEFAGKMNFYQTAVDNVFKSDKDAPTIGLILCRGKNKTIVEYTLRDVKSPMGVAEYRLLPPKLKTKLPPVSQLKDAVASLDVPKS